MLVMTLSLKAVDANKRLEILVESNSLCPLTSGGHDNYRGIPIRRQTVADSSTIRAPAWGQPAWGKTTCTPLMCWAAWSNGEVLMVLTAMCQSALFSTLVQPCQSKDTYL